MPANITAHNRRAEAFAQTGTILSVKTAALYVNSSRGFGRELAPMGSTQPSFRSRRYTIDASLVTRGFQEERDYVHNDYSNIPEDFSYLEQPSAKVHASPRETDEPVLRPIPLTLPDPLRYRDLHRWGRIWPQSADNKTHCRVGDAWLTNDDFFTIMNINGHDCWYRSNTIDVALQACSKHYEAEEHGIEVATTGTVQAFHSSINQGGSMADLRDYVPMLEGKQWIFIPMNDGIGQTSLEHTVGTHWSLLILDRPNKRAHYIDGLGQGMEPYARQFASIFKEVLGDEAYDFTIESHAPGQWTHNAYSGYDGGPCGPYVVKMIRLMIAHIRQRQQEGKPILFDFAPNDRSLFKFDSLEERWCLAYSLASCRASQVADERATEHDNAALGFPRPRGYTAFRNPPWSTYDGPLFGDITTLTFRKLENYRRLKELQQNRKDSMCSESSSGSSGGISIGS
jgi:hypothetical protein